MFNFNLYTFILFVFSLWLYLFFAAIEKSRYRACNFTDRPDHNYKISLNEILSIQATNLDFDISIIIRWKGMMLVLYGTYSSRVLVLIILIKLDIMADSNLQQPSAENSRVSSSSSSQLNNSYVPPLPSRNSSLANNPSPDSNAISPPLAPPFPSNESNPVFSPLPTTAVTTTPKDL